MADLDTCSGYVALKIDVSSIQGKNNEKTVLQSLRDSAYGQSAAGDRNIVRLLDDFIISGPNGEQDCLVMEVVGRMRDWRCWSFWEAGENKASYKLLQGLSYLHERGVAHGGKILNSCCHMLIQSLTKPDLHADNLGVGIPQLQNFSEDDIMDHFSNPETTAVVARDPHLSTEFFPAYLVQPVDLVHFLKKSGSLKEGLPFDLKILDFGGGT